MRPSKIKEERVRNGRLCGKWEKHGTRRNKVGWGEGKVRNTVLGTRRIEVGREEGEREREKHGTRLKANQNRWGGRKGRGWM